MLIIKLTKEQETTIDDEDIDLTNFKWLATSVAPYGFYAKRSLRLSKTYVKSIFLHRVIMERILERPLERKEEVDHINLNKLDNRRENLRLATRINNGTNRAIQSNNTSGYKGVSWSKSSKKWQVSIRIGGVQTHLGFYENIEEAAKIYNAASEKYHGEFGRKN